jgi:hypothetical protein
MLVVPLPVMTCVPIDLKSGRTAVWKELVTVALAVVVAVTVRVAAAALPTLKFPVVPAVAWRVADIEDDGLDLSGTAMLDQSWAVENVAPNVVGDRPESLTASEAYAVLV